MFFESTNQTHFEFDLPQSLPSGQYLLRIENIAIHATNVVGRPLQFFLSCAQINVANGGNGTPGPLVNVPGHYTGLEPGLDIDILNPPVTYIHPGPAVWQG
ncbi:endoglucanase II [Coprinopsis cinerea AmutBmut pab1-1]|nr:endoglucanase II [Coprinopsis cinerea AmutBmut pab1-1]